MPELTGHLWVSLSVRDLPTSLKWYERVLGFEVVSKSSGWEVGEAAILRDPGSSTSIGLIAHRMNSSERFAEHRTGLDHLEFRVPTRAAIEAWIARLDDLGVEHSGLEEKPGGNCIVTFRDPDNIQLEFFFDASR
jgi:glyoxylase I family protein